MLRRYIGVMAAVGVLAGLLAGCQYFIGANLPSVYLMNIDGRLVVRDMCSQALAEVEVQWDGAADGGVPPGVWHARATQPGIAEFVLFSDVQPGVELIADDTLPPSSSTAFEVLLTNSRGFEGGLTVFGPAEVEPGTIVWGNQSAPVEADYSDFERPRQDFGC